MSPQVLVATPETFPHLVRVELERQLAVRALDFLVRRAVRHAKDIKRVERLHLRVVQKRTSV